MECNRDEALRAKEIAERNFSAKDIVGAKKFALKAQNLFPSLEGITQMIETFDIYLAAEAKVNGESDWYAILCVNASADEETVRKQYRKLALQLHPDKNKSIGSEGAFKLISEAWSVLSDKSRKIMYDEKRNGKGFQQKVSQPDRDHSVPNSSNGFYNFANNTTSSKRARKGTCGVAQSAAPPPSRPSKLNTFWTSCNRCRMQYEYLRVYLNHNLLCPNCHQAFLAVETGVPTNGPNSSVSHSTKRHHQNSNYNSTMKNAYGHGNNSSTFSATGHTGFQHGGNVDSYGNTNFQWGSYSGSAGVASSTDSTTQAADMIHQTFEKLRRKYEETQGTTRCEEAPQSKNHVICPGSYNASASGNAYERERPASKLGRPAKRRNNGADAGVDQGRGGKEQMATGTGKIGASELERANGVYGDYGKTRMTAKQNNLSREYAQFDMKSILMEKVKVAIQKRLEAWNLDAAAKLAEKEMSKQKPNQKDKDNENVVDMVDGDAVYRTQSKVSRIGKKQIPDIKDSSNGHNVVSGKEPGKPISIDVPDPDFNDFDKDRTESTFQGEQVWATYDNEDGMPRLYALVQKVISLKPFKIRMSFLNSKSNSELGPLNWVASGFSKTCGDFRVGRYEISDTVNIFSHRVRWEKGPRGVIKIIPRKGDIWALYRNWSTKWNERTPDDVIYKYEMVEVLHDYNEEQGVSVTPLLKVAGFKTVFHRHLDPQEVRRIPREEMFRFSHQVPSYLLSGEEACNAPKGCHELDPAATPFELLQVITEVKEDVVMETAE